MKRSLRTLVIGTSGQLALELRRLSPAPGIELLPAQRVELADDASVSSLLDLARPELVINAAAYTAVDRAEDEPERAFAVNAEGPATLARWCERHGASLVQLSTDYVFDGLKPAPYLPSDPPSPLNVYGRSKLAGEVAVRSALPRHVILRTSWVFSAHGENFVKTMLRLARERDELRVVADQIGRPTPAADLARAVWCVAAELASRGEVSWGSYHFAGSGVTSWHAFAEAIVDEQRAITGREPAVKPIETKDFPRPATRPKSSVLDTSDFERVFCLEPAPWRDGLRDVVRNLLSAG
jgi:dTDP-4-dehydrorhamnose reductase